MITSNIVLAPQFRDRWRSIVLNPAGALLLTGPEGIGLGKYAHCLTPKIAAHVLPTNPKNELDDNGSISIDAIRALYDQTKVRFDSPHSVIIENCDRMTIPAQNALLKLLEEPPRSIIFILTSYHPEKLAPTILSRLQQVAIPPITHAQSLKIVDSSMRLTDQEKLQIMFIAEGLPELIEQLVSVPKLRAELFSQATAIKNLLASTNNYDSLKVVAPYFKEKHQAQKFLQLLLSIQRRLVTKNDIKQNSQRLAMVVTAIDQIAANQNVRLILTDFVLKWHKV